MENITLEKFLEIISCYYNLKDQKEIIKAYKRAKELHKGQYRQSGEEYIIHPLNVAYILAQIGADKDTICAGLLHDTLEDTKITKEELIEEFNKDIANLVDGVTKISKMNFSTKKEQNLANTRKIITGITEDVRIIIIKLADRLHNMRTLQYKTIFKQKENSLETMEIFVPLAYYIGAYRIKSELEDLSLQYLKPDIYKEIADEQIMIQKESKKCLTEMLYKIEKILNDKNIPNEIKIRIKNIYGIYKMKKSGYKLSHIHDLLSLKIMVNEVDECYRTLGFIHNEYKPINDKFKDYICNPKTNMYRSLHTTVFAPDDRLVQTQIRTFNMDKIASYGLTAYWDINKGEARDKMQHDLKEKYQFFESLTAIDEKFEDNKDFVSQIKKELFAEKIYVYTTKGDIIELPVFSTPIDFAYKISNELGNTMVEAFVNDEKVSFDYKLQNKDRVKIITNEFSKPKDEWIDFANTTLAKTKILEFSGK